MIAETAMASVFAMIGEEGFARMVAGFYRQVPTDDLLGPMYPPLPSNGCVTSSAIASAARSATSPSVATRASA